ncbi:DUF1538 domain-containing protein [Faecalibacterium sp. An121]|uniref:DUF1538 domain-containing protein n=1 Tax=Faecalibacterium sp. An121 TaxID=1965550 RepID=UPI000B37F871|nr:DUF1538 domain-containing protein [Faecalibacterium sp. An121]OUQ33850.1 hypothetical protein B5E66_12550 [Faecalibacterium sp. An121]
MIRKNALSEKLQEAVDSVLPIALIVSLLCFFFVPVGSGLMLSFLVGTVMIIAGMALFTLGSEQSMSQIGNLIGARLTKSRNIWLILALSFIMGVVITVAEPDLQVLATNVPGIDRMALIATVSVGVGLFLAVSMVRILLGIPLRWLLLAFYGLVFVLAFLSDPGFLAVSFDSGGVTTGPMTVPFIMALGVGVASIRSDEKAKDDSFGLVALCSIGPILAVLLLGFLYPGSAGSSETVILEFEDSMSLGWGYLSALPGYMEEVATALAPIFVFFLLFQLAALRLPVAQLARIVVGILYTYVGLVLFLTGVGVGFSSLGYVLGGEMVNQGMGLLLVPLAVLMGWFIINAEPAVHVLNKQVEDLTSGAISAKAMGRSLCIAVATANGLAMVRVLTGIPILWILVPGYLLALVLTFVVPPIFTAIAFDSGGVASGPMTATFMLPFAMGACSTLGGNVMTDAFGLVALVALMPLITVQVMGAVYVVKLRRSVQPAAQPMPAYGDDEIIELWEEVA